MLEPIQKNWFCLLRALAPLAAVVLVIAFVMFVRHVDTSADGVPREGFMAVREDLGTWIENDDPLEESSTIGNELHLTVASEVWAHPDSSDHDPDYPWGVDQVTAREDFDDFSATVDIRAIDADPGARACLKMRTGWDEDSAQASEGSEEMPYAGHYSLNICLSDEYGVYGWWRDYTDGKSVTRSLWFDGSYESVIKPVDEWNRLKVIAKGKTLWVFLNGEYIGAGVHDGPQTGSIGVSIEIPYETTGTIAFRNLEIRRLGWI